MKRLVLALLFTSVFQGAAVAGGGAGSFSGATELTQALNLAELTAQTAQEVLSYQNMLMQYDTMLRNLEKNPLGVIAPDVARMVQGQAQLMAMGKDIASTMSKVDANFAQTFKDPAGVAAQGFSTKFSNWTNASQEALKAAMLNAGLQRQNFSNDQAALQQLVDNVSAANGAVGGLQALGSLNAAQIQESMKLRDLISQQQVAQNTYMAVQNAKQQDVQDVQSNTMTMTDRPMPAPRPKKPGNF